MFDLFGNKITTNKKKVHPFDKLAAIDLLQAINPRKKWSHHTINKEADAIRLLRTQDHVSQEEVEQVLDYHCANIRHQYHPLAFSGVAFRKKFNQIKASYIRMNPQEEALTISPESKSAVKRLRMLGWPKGSADHLEREFQLSANWLVDFRHRLIKLREAATPSQQTILTGLMQRLPKNWVESHYVKVHRKVSGWDDWSGDLKFYRMSLDNKDINTTLQEILLTYAGERAASFYSRMIKDCYES